MHTVRKSVAHVVLMIYVGIVLYPFLFVLFSSLKTDNQAIASNPWGWPSVMTFNNYKLAWVNAKMSVFFLNSVYISLSASLAAVLLGAAASFALTRMRFGRMSAVSGLFLALGLFIPGNALIIPIYSLLVKMKLYNTPLALILPYIAFGLPLTIVIVSAFMRSLPSEVEEAGVMDGLKPLGLFVRVILPITVPALVTVFIVNFLGNWNEFLMANFYLKSEKLRTLPVGMVGFRDSYNTNYAQLSAGIVYSVAPVLVLYAVLQEKIIEGVTAGSVKG
ncbi:carbohydrate ABC transporter permease [Paenibacillus chartarius]|uniref:Carbohydrate ABC transporter permease n=1 Tax=Paenibacillus chartarius TaxID=747481 RepID=A0ABV6DH72_9BACL